MKSKLFIAVLVFSMGLMTQIAYGWPSLTGLVEPVLAKMGNAFLRVVP